MFWRNWIDSLRAFIRSFHYAGQGVWRCLEGRNFRFQTAAGLCALLLARYLGLTAGEWAILWLTIGLVLGLEGLNTALEAAVDLSSPQLHPLTKRAKDCAAAGVLLAALASLGVGAALLWQPLRLKALAIWWCGTPLRILAGAAAVLLGLWYIFIGPACLQAGAGHTRRLRRRKGTGIL